MHTKGINKKLDLPHEAGEWIEIRKVSSGYVDAARDIASRKAQRGIKDMGGIANLTSNDLKRCPKCDAQLIEGHQCNPLDVFAKEEREANPSVVGATLLDRKTMLNAGIIGWSAEVKVGEESIADLDETTAYWAFQEIVNYVNETQTVEAKKGGTKSSTAT